MSDNQETKELLRRYKILKAYEQGDSIRAERAERSKVPYNPRLDEIRRKASKAKTDLREFKEGMEAAKNPLNWSWEDWKELLRSDIRDNYLLVKEMITGKVRKELQNDFDEAKRKEIVAEKLYSLTGGLPGDKSGVVMADKIAEEEIKKHRHKIKINASRLLAYGKDDELKEQVMTEIGKKYPELVPEIKNLAKKAKQRAEIKTLQNSNNR